jgi:hypothetical protein
MDSQAEPGNPDANETVNLDSDPGSRLWIP